MILYKLKELECSLEKKDPTDLILLENLRILKELLLKIDFQAENIPENNYKKLLQVLIEINGANLSPELQKVLDTVVHSN
ncbi:hypothetical protein [Siansivirga zeaxanthinifaciens]|uniref:Uncharacterized protein n=1 Tax=Siansivirga zeaxanthinifaciens CC-SAMT-1 TaxID=1454006 RepID=A0A0C5WIN1_9FLAO|nr:hypothetical protein [Siansivirga zeaxanthinifaciens]AJR05024.1 hypothetical protein AW14_14710 [Siansivirga zeaxanthinifaciens CC-SAMT-1]